MSSHRHSGPRPLRASGPRAGLTRACAEVALTLGALLGLVCLVVALLGVVGDVRALVFRSGSMSPAVATGDLGIARTVDAADLRVGDVVSVTAASGERITHRITAVSGTGDQRQLQLKGDANRVPDAEVYAVDHADRLLFHVPKAGYAVGWLSGRLGLFALGVLAAVLVSIVVRGGPGTGDSDGGRRRATRQAGARGRARAGMATRAASTTLAVVLAAGASCGALLAHRTQPTLAAWTDGVPITGTTVVASTVPVPTGVTCSGTWLYRVTLSWSAVSGATGYTVHYGTGGSQTIAVTATSYQLSTAWTASSGTIWVTARTAYTSTTWESAASPSFSYTTGLLDSTCA